MSEMDDRLNAILGNPQMLQQIMALAQSLNSSPQAERPQASAQSVNHSVINPSFLNRISSVMQKSNIDNNQQSLLKALSPYLSRSKIQKLERAMFAAKIAGVASEMMGTKGPRSISGR